LKKRALTAALGYPANNDRQGSVDWQNLPVKGEELQDYAEAANKRSQLPCRKLAGGTPVLWALTIYA
jgi:hypothetical protein